MDKIMPPVNLPEDLYTMVLHKNDPMKGILLELHIEDNDPESEAFLAQFRKACFDHLNPAPAGKPIPAGADAVPWYLQGESGFWLMIEFWTRDRAAIQRAVNRVVTALRSRGVEPRLEIQI